MRAISVEGIAIEIPVVGFGCSSLSRDGKANANRVLAAAYDAGVRHFDVARYYGYGESEALLGSFLKSRRPEVTIATKFGIDPPRRTGALRLAMQAARKLVRLVPAARATLQRGAQSLVRSGDFSAAKARTSLETSLRELATDYVDFFLLHDYAPGETPPDELVAFLEDARKAGKIRYFGLGTGIEHILRALQSQPQLCGVLQFENSVLCRNREKLPGAGPYSLIVTHGSLGSSYRTLSTFLAGERALAKEWSAALELDCTNGETLADLMLNYAVQANPKGLVLFSSGNASRVTRNVKAVLDPGVSHAQVERFAELVARDVFPRIESKVLHNA